jgi:hypothetical protein
MLLSLLERAALLASKREEGVKVKKEEGVIVKKDNTNYVMR